MTSHTIPRRRKLLIAAAFSMVAFGGSAAAVVAQGKDGPPPRPPWLNTDGHGVDASKLPGQVPIVGPNGQVQRDSKGNPRTVDPRGLHPLPGPPDPNAVATPGAVSGAQGAGQELRPDQLRRP